jgi:uncharacterized protein (TIGR00730 family)
VKRICVFCGSNTGNRSEYKEIARKLGKELAKEQVELVYGGSSIGLMGIVADSVLEHHGVAIGVIPTALFRGEMVHRKLTHLYKVKDMHERKAKMGELSDAFIALPGGYGTFEELFEVVSWGQLGIHTKPIGLLNIAGYYEPLMKMISKAAEEGFILPRHKELIICESEPAILLQKLREYTPVADTIKWSELPPSYEV